LEIIEEVKAVIANSLKIPVDRLTPDARLEELGAESLDVIEIVFALEEKFDITIPVDAAPKKAGGPGDPAQSDPMGSGDLQFATIGELAATVQKLVDASTAR
jgi:acyl carrier protein